MLRGSAFARVDGKGRIKLPAPFRTVIESKYGAEFFVTSVKGDSVQIYPMDVWCRLEERLAAAPSTDPSVIKFRNAVNFYGQSSTMDGQGRVLIHSSLREKTATSGDVTVLGQHDHLEVWNRAAFQERMDAEPVSDEDMATLAGLGI